MTENIVLNEQEMDAVNRLADRFHLTAEDVVETLLLAATDGDRLTGERG